MFPPAEHPYQHSRRSLRETHLGKVRTASAGEAVAGWEKEVANATVGKITEHFRKTA